MNSDIFLEHNHLYRNITAKKTYNIPISQNSSKPPNPLKSNIHLEILMNITHRYPRR